MNKQPQISESTKIKDEIVKEIVAINHSKAGSALVRPNLAIIQVGEEKETNKFIVDLEKESIRVGVDSHIYKCPLGSDEDEVSAMIECLNEDNSIDGILVTLPLPDGFNQETILSLVKAEKDLSYIIEAQTADQELLEANIFRACLDNFKVKQSEEL